jgi:hypothetical protein
MPNAPEAFPWWLWTLAALWGGTLLVWLRGGLSRDLRWGLGAVLAVYTGLLTWVVNFGPTAWTPSRGLFWLGGSAAIGGSLLLLRATTVVRRRSALGLITLGVAGLFALLGAVELAGATILVGGLIAARTQQVERSTAFAIPQRDALLIGAAAVLVLVAWFGGVRYALLVESHRPGPSRWLTALPSRVRLTSWLVTEPGLDGAASPTSRPPRWPWELLALSGVWVWMAARGQARGLIEFPVQENE